MYCVRAGVLCMCFVSYMCVRYVCCESCAVHVCVCCVYECVSVCAVCVLKAGALMQAGHSPTCAAPPPSLGHPVLLLGGVPGQPWGLQN